MEDGGVDMTFYRLLATPVEPNGRLFSPFDYFGFWLDAPQIKCQTIRHTPTNLVNTTLFEKYVDP